MNIAKRFKTNPILTPADIVPSRSDMTVKCLLNPGAFKFKNKTYLLMRVCESFEDDADTVSATVVDEQSEGGIGRLQFKKDDPKLDYTDPRVFIYEHQLYLTTLSHLRLAESDDGITFTAAEKPLLQGVGPYEKYGIEDARVSQIGDQYVITYTACSSNGAGVGCQVTSDWKTFKHLGVIMPPFNKDCAVFEEKINGNYFCFHRPIVDNWGALNIWTASSPDLVNWGNHKCILKTRPDKWDCERIGAGCAPVKTDHGWLEIYHGANKKGRYCLGALLLDLNDPARVIARSEAPIMEPVEEYEIKGFYGNCVFTNGQVVEGDTLRVYYGASDTVICGVDFSIREILGTLGR